MFIFTLLVSLTTAIASLYYWLRGKEGGERTDSYRAMTLFFGIAALVCALLLVPGEFWDQAAGVRLICVVIGLASAVFLAVTLFRKRRKTGTRLLASGLTFAVLLMLLCGLALDRDLRERFAHSSGTAMQEAYDRSEEAKRYAETLLAEKWGVQGDAITTSGYGFAVPDGDAVPPYYMVGFLWNENGVERIYGYHVMVADDGSCKVLAEGEAMGRETIGTDSIDGSSRVYAPGESKGRETDKAE